jgi:hypothetical protein
MKKFRQLLEMPRLMKPDAKEDQKSRGSTLSYLHPGKKISEFKGYHIHSTEPDDPKNTTIYAKDPASGESHMHVNFDGGQIVGLEGSLHSKIKAHEFYHHLISHHGIELKSDIRQTPGGMKVWKKLKEYPDVKITHHKYTSTSPTDNSTKRIPLRKDFEKNYGNELSYFKAVKK